MPVSAALGAMALGSAGMQGLWQYNRDNYFFDVPLRQSRQFQLQNIGMSRFALFREDLRDLSCLTTDKVQNYFVINTLKLGFIVTIFFNFDRIDTEVENLNYTERQISLLFSVTLMTAFFYLLASIWLSMHAVLVAESVTTKLLVQACRIPLPTLREVDRAATDAKHFEGDFAEAFRVPFLGDRLKKKVAEGLTRHPAETLRRAASSSERPQDDARSDNETEHEDALRYGATISRKSGVSDLSILDILDGSIDDNLASSIESTLEPHIKFYKLVRPSWTGFDLYGKIAMEIGTASLLSGLGYYALFYLRDSGGEFHVSNGGWIAYAFLTVLAWYSLVLDLAVSCFKHFLLLVPMVGNFMGTIYYIGFESSGERHPWFLTFVVLLQAVWVNILAWSGVGFKEGYPAFWRATRYLNVLHFEKGPSPLRKDLLTMHRDPGPPPARSTQGQGAWTWPGAPLSGRTSPSSAGSLGKRRQHSWSFRKGTYVGDASSDDDTELEWSFEAEQPSNVSQAFAAAFPLLHCLGVILESAPLAKHRKQVHMARDRLYEAARAAGALPVGAGSADTAGLIRPFLVILPSNKRSNLEPYRVDMGRVDRASSERPPGSGEAPQVALAELLKAAERISDALYADAMTWTVRDMRRLAQYGGEPIPGVASFLAQFSSKGSSSTHFPGSLATVQFRTGVMITTLLWLGSLAASVVITVDHFHLLEGQDPNPLQAASRELTLHLPRPWLLPSLMGCDGSGQRMVMGDMDGVYVGGPNNSVWQGPFRPCWGAEALSADFGPDGRLWLSTTKGIHEVPLNTNTAGVGVVGAVGAGVGVDAAGVCRPPGDYARVLEKMALDSLPSPGSHLHGVALVGGRLHALENSGTQGWGLAGVIGTPDKRKVKGLAMRKGRVLVLDVEGVVYRLDVASGKWEEQPVAQVEGCVWTDICVLPQRGWIAMGRHRAEVGVRRIWEFLSPSPWDHQREEQGDERKNGAGTRA